MATKPGKPLLRRERGPLSSGSATQKYQQGWGDKLSAEVSPGKAKDILTKRVLPSIQSISTFF